MASRVSSPELVGREPELAELGALLAGAQEGSPALVLVAGESGVGKSRLVAELAGRAEADGARTLVGECIELSEGEIPFAPLTGALRRLVRGVDADELAALLGPAGDELGRVFPELAPGRDRPRDGASLDAMGQARLFELMLGLLDRLGRERPLVLIVEDLHWADRSTRDLLLFLARNLRDERVLIVVTYRSDELHRRHPLRPFLAQIEGAASVTRMDLGPLSRDEVAAQLERILGEVPAPGLIDAIHERAEGNPFYTEELLAARSEGALPPTLRDALLLRVEMLSPAAQEVLWIAATAGRRVQHRLLAAVAELPERELLDALREAVGAHLLVEAADEASYEFRHALLREAVYSDLLPGERGKLHVALAEALERDPQLAGLGAAVAAELAYHWHAAHELGRALAASVAAGSESESVYAFAEAQRHFERALEVWDHVDDAERVAGLDQVALLLRAAEVAQHAGEVDRALALGRQAVAEMPAGCDPLRAALARERLARYLWLAGYGDEALIVVREAVAIVPGEPSEGRARVLAAEAQLLMLSDRSEEARERSAEALAIARAVGARHVEANVLNTLVPSAGTNTGDTEAALAWMNEARALAEELDLVEEIFRSYVNGGDALDQAGRVEEAIQVARDGIEASRRLGTDRSSGNFLRAELASRLVRVSRWDEAAAVVRDVMTMTNDPLATAVAAFAEAQVTVARGDFAAARRAADRALALARRARGSMWQAQLAFPYALLAVMEGQPEDARTIVEETLAAHGDGEYVFFTAELYRTGARAEADIAERARPLRDDAAIADAERRCRRLLTRLDELIGAYPRDPPPLAVAGRAAVAAELGRVRGESDAGAWSDVADRFDALGQVYDGAYARFRAAEALVRTGGAGEAASAMLAQARAVAERHGMTPLLGEIDSLARRARLRLATPTDGDVEAAAEDGGGADLGLTARELEVLQLVAEGCTNREIGERLYMSEKTASVHVSRIIAKLGAANRTEAAASAQRLGLVGAR